MNTYMTLFNKVKQAAYEIKVLQAAVCHGRSYNTQLDVLSAIERAKFSFKAEAAELQAYVQMRRSRMDLNRVSFQLRKWGRALDVDVKV